MPAIFWCEGKHKFKIAQFWNNIKAAQATG
jgi:hypothetical protein